MPVRCGSVSRPDVAAVGQETVGLAFGEGRIGEQRGRQRLQGQTDAELLHHVRLARIVEVHLDRTGPEHHVEAHRADARHVPQHDVVAALGHDRQLVATRLVGPQAEAEEGDARRSLADQSSPAPGDGRSRRRSDAGSRVARPTVRAGPPGSRLTRRRCPRHGDDIAAFQHRLPAELGQRHQQVANAAGFRHRSGARRSATCDRRTSRARCRCASARRVFHPSAWARPTCRGSR
jgi:hypothetical protein